MTTIADIAAEFGIDAIALSGSLKMDGIKASDIESGDAWSITTARSLAQGAAKRRAISRRLAVPVQLTAQAKASQNLQCFKCGGSGKIDAFGHISGGTCFQCSGTGILRRRGA